MIPIIAGIERYFPVRRSAKTTPIISKGIAIIIVIGCKKDLNCDTNKKYTNITANTKLTASFFIDSSISSFSPVTNTL